MSQVRILTSVRRIKPVVYYDIVTPSEVIHKAADGTLTPCDFALKIRRRSGAETTYITTDEGMSDESLYIQHASSTGVYATFPITDDINSIMIGNGIRFRLMKGNTVLDEKTMPVIADGDNAVVYKIVSPVQNVVVKEDGTCNPASLTVKVLKTVGGSSSELTTYQQCQNEGLSFHFKTINGTYWRINSKALIQ